MRPQGAPLLKAGLFLGAAGVLTLAGLYAMRRLAAAGSSLGITGDTLNPFSDLNIVYSTLNAGVQSVTDANQTVGGFWSDLVNPRAGLADNEYSPSRGVIVTTTPSEALQRAMVTNEGGAAVGRTVPRGF